MKKLLSVVLSLVMVLGFCAPAWATDGGSTVVAQAATQAQINALAKELSDAEDGATIELEALHYGQLHLGSGAYPYDYPANLKIVGKEGTSFTGFSVSNETISGWTFQNITFIGDPTDNEGNTDGMDFSTQATVTGLTIDNCKFVNGAAFSMINTTSANFANVVIKNGTSFSDTEGTAILLQGVNGFEVTGCTFTNVGYNAIQTNSSTGNCSITGNTINGSGSRAMRIATKSGVVLTISGNTMTDANNPSDETVADRGQVIKVSGAGTNGTFANNTHNGMAISFANGVAYGPVAQVGETTYASLQDAVNAAADAADKTATLLTDVNLTAEVVLADGVKLDGQGKTIAVADSVVADNTKWVWKDH